MNKNKGSVIHVDYPDALFFDTVDREKIFRKWFPYGTYIVQPRIHPFHKNGP